MRNRRFLALMVAAMLLPGAPALAEQAEIPVEVTAGPALFGLPAPVGMAFGLKFEAEAVITHDLFLKHRDRVPAQYQGLADRVLSGGEANVGYSMLIPQEIIVSPGASSSVYGLTWRPIGSSVGLFSSGYLRAEIGLGLILTGAYITAPSTLFVRPGLALEPNLSLGPRWLNLTAGWSSRVYVPQKFGGSVSEIGDGTNVLWHIGGPFATLSFRFPARVKL